MGSPPHRTEPSLLIHFVAPTRKSLSYAVLIAIAALAVATGAYAQASDGLKAGAYDAQRAADEAAAAAAAARQQAAEAAERLQAAEAAAARASEEAAAQSAAVEQAESAAPAAAAAAVGSAELEKARAEAERANRKADAALAAVRELENRFAYDRDGMYMGGGVFYAPQSFDTHPEVSVATSRGASGWIGYRFANHFALEARADYVDDFDFESPRTSGGQLSGWLATANAKIFLMRGRVQPYFNLGVGAFMSSISGESLDPLDPGPFSVNDTNAAFRGSFGFDIYLSPSFLLNLDAAFTSVHGDLDAVKFGQLGGGLTFRF